MNFRRYYVPGSAVFITQIVQDRDPVFRDSQHVNMLRQILRNVKELHPFVMLGYVFLSDHFHMIIQPTANDKFSSVMHSLKTNFTREYKRQIGLSSSQSMKFWQKRFWDHVIRDNRDFENHLHYIHFNPVKHDVSKTREAGNIAVTSNGKNAGCILQRLIGMSPQTLIGASRSRL